VLLIALACIARKGRSGGGSDQIFGLAMTVMLLVSPLVWPHYLVLMLLPVAIVWVTLPASNGLRGLFLLAVLNLWVHPVIWYMIGLGLLASGRMAESSARRIMSALPSFTLLGVLSCQLVLLRAAFA